MINTNFITYKNNYHLNPAFKGQRLFSLNLKKTLNNGKDYELIPAFFTKLDGEEDLTLLNSIQNLWNKTTYWKKIYQEFQESLLNKRLHNPNRFFMIECPIFKNPLLQIRAISKTNDTPNELYISYIQSATEIAELEKVNGAGYGIMRGLCKIAQQETIPQIGLTSSKNAVSFYDKLKLTKEQPKHNDFMTYQYAQDKKFFSYNAFSQKEIKDNCFYGFHLEAKNYNKFLIQSRLKYGDIIEIKN